MMNCIFCNSCNLFNGTHGCRNIVSCKWSLQFKNWVASPVAKHLFFHNVRGKSKKKIQVLDQWWKLNHGSLNNWNFSSNDWKKFKRWTNNLIAKFLVDLFNNWNFLVTQLGWWPKIGDQLEMFSSPRWWLKLVKIKPLSKGQLKFFRLKPKNISNDDKKLATKSFHLPSSLIGKLGNWKFLVTKNNLIKKFNC
jgi:hypothetical protein